MKKLGLFLLIIITYSCNNPSAEKESQATENTDSQTVSKEEINKVLEDWHAAAAQANFEEYFGLMSGDGIFIGTDATENWQNKEFREFAKPYFDKGKAWSFTTLERNIYISENGETAWFDELLNTQTGICRGSGVLEKTQNAWKIKHYVLSIAIPNENVNEITQIKKEFDSALISKLQ
jgi:ketosteroid isomerase-like protein